MYRRPLTSYRWPPRPSRTTNSRPGPLRWLPSTPPGRTRAARSRRFFWSLMPTSPLRRKGGPSYQRSPAGALDELARAREVRRVHHLPLEAERVRASGPMLLEQRHQLTRLGDLRLVGGEGGIDDLDLAGMDRDLAGESHGHAVLALAPEPVEVGDVGVDGIEPVDAGCRGGHRTHCARIARDVEVPAALVAHPRQSHRRAEVLDAPRDGDDAGAGGGDLADVEQPLRCLGGDGQQSRRAGRDTVAMLEQIQQLGD